MNEKRMGRMGQQNHLSDITKMVAAMPLLSHIDYNIFAGPIVRKETQA